MSFAQSRTSGEFGVQRCCFVRKTTVPEGLCSLLHPAPCFTPEFPLQSLLQVLGFFRRHGGFPFFRWYGLATDSTEAGAAEPNVGLGWRTTEQIEKKRKWLIVGLGFVDRLATDGGIRRAKRKEEEKT